MIIVLKGLLIISMMALLFTLFMGARAFSQQDAPDRSLSNKWMQRRVYAQMVTVFLVVLILFMRRVGT